MTVSNVRATLLERLLLLPPKGRGRVRLRDASSVGHQLHRGRLQVSCGRKTHRFQGYDGMSCAATDRRAYCEQPALAKAGRRATACMVARYESMHSPSVAQLPRGTSSRPPVRRWWRYLLFPALLVANFLLIQVITPGQPQRVEVSYTFFKQQVEADNVAQISTRADTIQGTFTHPVAYQPDRTVAAKTVSDFSTVIPAFADPGLETLLAGHGGVINARPLDQPANPFLTILLGFGPTLLLIGGFLWLSRKAAGQMGGGLFGLGKSQAKRYDQTTIGDARVTFADAAGIEEAKAELVEIVDFLKDP